MHTAPSQHILRFLGIAFRVMETEDGLLLRAQDVALAVRVRDVQRECKGRTIAKHCHQIRVPSGFGYRPYPFLTIEGAVAFSHLSRSPERAEAFREWLKQDFQDQLGAALLPPISALPLLSVNFNGRTIRRADAEGATLFNAQDCGHAIAVCNLKKVAAMLLDPSHSREIVLPCGDGEVTHLYLTVEGAAELSKLSPDYETPKAFRAWLKTDFPPNPSQP